ncbi:TRM11 family SAM-dependent methyltransferase [Aquibacillus salsiterrae]|uniref:RsmD family RNA methyltransferase n=1 Tax=Aquibacillus salsiterrae TaxID=2950439 RepID=A0A9X4AF25_9BACI|nr:RsmD family RNA methyltransferase [Aquibacillus salsiterrae]MDC3417431.1 RsmD family RNA methyltransferase [Aquibacillus salsiterrae]
MNHLNQQYIYNYSCAEEEKSLCKLEMRAFFGKDTNTGMLKSERYIDPNRSPFIKEQLTILYEASNFSQLKEQVNKTGRVDGTFKVVLVNPHDVFGQKRITFKERRMIEREVGLCLRGEVSLDSPDKRFAVMNVDGQWIFGLYQEAKSIWLTHQKKPHQYSTALNTRVARAVVNIAIPRSTGIKAIDPCCGIGTVLIEALSMGVNIVGNDRNPLIMKGVRENIKFFGYETDVLLKDMRDITEQYDVAIIDMPYNLCSVLSKQEKITMLKSARSFTRKLVVISLEEIESAIATSGFTVKDRGFVKKGSIIRQVIVCE